jgi:hypothetical protein
MIYLAENKEVIDKESKEIRNVMATTAAIHHEEIKMKTFRFRGLLFEGTLALSAVSKSFSACDPLSKVGRSVRRLLPSLVLLAAIAAPALGQVITPRPTVPGIPPKHELPRLPMGDLVIQSVNINDAVVPAPATIAKVSVMNKGPADIVFPAGSMLVRGDAAQPGGIAFPALTTPTEFMIASGASKDLTLSVGDVCTAGNPGPVTFRVDPANVVRETDDGNNAISVQVSSFASGDLRAVSVLVEIPNASGDVRRTAYPATESVKYVNEGPGPILFCPGVTLWRETASPVSSKYGLREIKNTSGKAIVYNPSNNNYPFQSEIPGALQPGDLPPGRYTWSIVMNPDGKIRETRSSNNAVTNQSSVQ